MGTSAVAPSTLPPLYAPWIEDVLGGPVPEERHPTCSSCAMCRPTNAAAATASLTEFDPATKCCTYVPTLPNFLVGMVLEDDDPAAAPGRESVERRIAAGVGVTPLGLQTDPRYAVIYKHAGGPLLGQAAGLRCPHYRPEAGGACGTWRHRNAVCATWFCKHERGQVGKRFWDALRQVLPMAERRLALWAATELGESLDGPGPALLPYYATVPGSTGNRWSPRWADRPGVFYRASAGLVGPLAWTEVVVPPYLRLGAVRSLPRAGARRALLGYSPHDMPVLPEPVARALDRFEGRRPTERVCEELSEAGAPIDLPEALRLFQFGVLCAAESPEEARA